MILTEYNEELRKKTLREEGFAEGFAEGLAEACAEAYEEGVELCANLIKILLSSGRLKDAERAASDKAFRDALFKEYKLL